MSRLTSFASALRSREERDAVARSDGTSGPRTQRAAAWAGLYVGFVEDRREE